MTTALPSDMAATAFYVLGSAAFLAHLLSMLNSYLKIREMRVKAHIKRRKVTAPMYAVKKKLAGAASSRTPNRPAK